MRINHGAGAGPKVDRWAFLARNQAGTVFYIDQDGFSITVKDIIFFEGTEAQARQEADRRSGLYGNRGKEKLKSVVYQKLTVEINDLPDYVQRLNDAIAKVQIDRGQRARSMDKMKLL